MTQATSLRLAIVDDHEVFRLGLRTLLERTGAVEVAWDTDSPHDAWSRIATDPVDAVLVDLNLGGPVDGLEAARMLTGRYPHLRVVLMSGLVDEKRLMEARQAGVVGFLPKALAAEELLTSLQAMVGPPTSGAPREPLRPLYEDELGTPIGPLSPRETEVLAEIRLGRTNREIAAKLRVSTTTVNKHVHQVLRKLRVRNRAEAAIVAGSLLSRPRR
jgi:DNA-binding NarL/FixJ family response regulator